MRRALFAFFLFAVTEGAARADDDAPISVTHEYSPYEKETIVNALAETQREIEPAPEGKIVEGVDVVTLEVFEKRDPIPRFLNVFHYTSRHYAIERELLLKPGQAYSQVVVDETARNLRALSSQLSLVLVLAVKGSKPGTVRILLITKDVWSLRLNSSYVLTNNGLEYLFLQPSEQNVLGTHHVAAVNFELRPLSYTLGGSYRIPWVFDTRWRATIAAAMDWNRDTGKVDGSTGSTSLRYPLWSTRTPLGANLSYEWAHHMVRQYSNGSLAGYKSKLAAPDSAPVPWQYREDYDYAHADAVRAFGWARKVAFTLGAEAIRDKYTTGDLSGYDPASASEFVAKKVPQSDTRVGPFGQVRLYSTDYVRVLDVDIYSLQEDFRLGYDVLAKVYPVFSALGSTRTFVGVDTRAQYTFALGDGFIRPAVFNTIETTGDRTDTLFLRGLFHVVSPKTPAGRLVYDADFTRRFRNYYNSNTTLGGSRRLRGYPTNYLTEPNAVAQTVEWRTRPLDILRTQWGLVGFWDAATAYESTSDLQMHNSVGLGVRALFPQFDRIVTRFDFGVPIYRGERPAGVSPYAFLISVEQAFPVPNIIDPGHTID
ncbi:MAG: hypothetical protein ACXWUG_14325 [Polyangiales bacterium]